MTDDNPSNIRGFATARQQNFVHEFLNDHVSQRIDDDGFYYLMDLLLECLICGKVNEHPKLIDLYARFDQAIRDDLISRNFLQRPNVSGIDIILPLDNEPL